VIDQTLVQAFQQSLADEHRLRLYAVLDGASIANLPTLLTEQQLPHVCLMPGELEPELAQAAPYLVQLPARSPFAGLFLTQGVGSHWGILATSAAGLRTLRMHLRALLSVWGPDGQPLFFRYYDPRVLRVYLPTCTAGELSTLFGPVSAYYAADESGEALLRFAVGATGLGQQRVTLARPVAPA
jgi:hypothetical protein